MKHEITDNSIRVLEDMLLCNVGCAGDFKPSRKRYMYEEDMIDWLAHNLPTLPYVADQIINFIFSNGLTTGDEKKDERLNEWLFAKNKKGTTNYSVLREGIKQAMLYGKNGIRWLSEEDGIINVESKHYACLVDEDNEYYGFDDTIGYIVAMKKQKIWETDLDEIEFDEGEFERKGIVVDKDRKIMIIADEEFLNLRNDTTKDNGDSPLKYDLQRTQLLMTAYERLNYDLEYDGPGRLLFRLKPNIPTGTENEVSTSEITNQSTNAKSERVRQVKTEAEAIGKKIKDSTSDNVIVVSDVFEKDIMHLPRITQATQFFTWLENEGVIICQIFGINPTLIGLGKVSGNVSMEKIIDNAMLNVIVPMREKYASQISTFLAPKLGFEKIYFDKYDMQQAVDENDKRLKVVNMIEKLVKSGYNKVADKMAEMLENDLDAGDGGLKKLSVKGLINKFKKLLLGGHRKDE